MHVDISHPIRNESDMNFRKESIVPSLLFLEDGSEGISCTHSKIDNLLSSYGTHVCFPGMLSDLLINKTLTNSNKIENFIGRVLILDISFFYKKITRFFSDGILNIDILSKSDVASYLDKLLELEVSLKDFDKELFENISGVLFYTGLSKLWEYRKYDLQEHMYFQSINISKSLCDLLISNSIKFVGVDAFSIGNPLAIYSGYESIFSSCGKDLYKYHNFIENHDCHDAADYLLKNNVCIYRNLNIPYEAVGKFYKFSGVPINIDICSSNVSSIVRPYIYDD